MGRSYRDDDYDDDDEEREHRPRRRSSESGVNWRSAALLAAAIAAVAGLLLAYLLPIIGWLYIPLSGMIGAFVLTLSVVSLAADRFSGMGLAALIVSALVVLLTIIMPLADKRKERDRDRLFPSNHSSRPVC